MSLDRHLTRGNRVLVRARALEQPGEGHGRVNVDWNAAIGRQVGERRLHSVETQQRGAVLAVREQQTVFEHDSIAFRFARQNGAAPGEDGFAETRHVEQDARELGPFGFDFAGFDAPIPDPAGQPRLKSQTGVLLCDANQLITQATLGRWGDHDRHQDRDQRRPQGKEQAGSRELTR